ncbi:restriction endonuclease [Novosphingobium sp. KACC 22771]|uniref:restriction endonuclease n=1 Tax=Novosphingobium sp. KACC 22771 TaxID=3025670 RepID=UPI00236713D6|nr:restriction endonuclease [Novosphingobium sp. KACC 22771]WDF75232.1 restriction endonuclease [Novosphingobium sp. KACC 22771]
MLLGLSALMLVLLTYAVSRTFLHRWRRLQARVMAAQLRGRDRPQPPQFLYARLRAMDPFAFEELLVESFERSGHEVERNHRYIGDGGIDGQVAIDGHVWLFQAKRYADSIRPEHVAAFENLCRLNGQRGLFIHTGRTGPQSRAVITDGSVVQIISGRALLALLTDGSLPMLASSANHAQPGSALRRSL